MSYEERLLKLNLPSLEYKRHRGDMIQVYKIDHKHYDKLSIQDLITFKNDDRLRRHNFTIVKKQTNKKSLAIFFPNRVVNSWNKLPYYI